MSSDPPRSGSGPGTPTRPNVVTPAALVAKKRARLAALTPADLLRQRKRRGGAAAGLSSARKLAGSIRSSPLTQSKPRGIQQLSGLVLPDGSASPSASSSIGGSTERKSRRQSSMSRTAGGEAELDDGDDDLVPIEHHRPADGAADDEDDDEAQADRSGAAGANVGGEAPSLDEDTLHLIKQSKEEIKELWDQMSEEQRQRFDVYRRTALNKASMKKLVTGVLNQQISSTLTFVVAGFSKVFVGQIVERAVQVQSERGEDGPLKPEHLREAYRLYKKENQSMSGGSSSSSGFTKRMF